MENSDQHRCASVAGSQSSSSTSQKFSELPTSDETCDELTDRQRLAMDLILAGATDTATAAAVGVSRRTIYQWRVHDEVFRAVLLQRRRDAFENATDRLRTLLSQALDLLERHVRDPYAPTALRAARTMLALARIGTAVSETAAPTDQRGTRLEPDP